MKRYIFLLIILCASCTYIRKDRYGRTEGYGFVTLQNTNIYETKYGYKVIGMLPKYYSFMINKNILEIDNGLIHVNYDTGVQLKEYPDGWVKLNDLKLFNVWKYKEVDLSTQRDVSKYTYPIEAAKASQYIASYDKNQTGWSNEYLNAIEKNEIQLGMSSEMVMLALGIPSKVNKNKGSEVIEEQWIYTKSPIKSYYVYFKDGRVVNSQIVGENIEQKK
jgi:hypothetical protein